jgi:hypothetical protein
MLNLQICHAFINYSPNYSFQDLFKLKKNALIIITLAFPNYNFSF